MNKPQTSPPNVQNEQKVDPGTQEVPRSRNWVVTLLVAVMLLIGFGITGSLVYITQKHTRESEEAHFQYVISRAHNLVKERLSHYEILVRSGKALFDSSVEVDPSEWRSFVTPFDLHRNFPGVEYFAYLSYVRQADLKGFLAGQQKRYGRHLVVHPAGKRPYYCIMTYIEPEHGNKKSLGYDSCRTSGPRNALLEARDSGKVVFSSGLNLQDEGVVNDRGVIVVAPVFGEHAIHDTVAHRRQSLKGWVGIPVPVRLIMQGLLSPKEQIHTDLFASTKMDQDNLLYRAGPDLVKGGTSHPDGTLQVTYPLPLGDRIWALRFVGLGKTPFPYKVALVGTLITLLVVLIVLVSGRTRARAYSLAQEMLHALRASEGMLSSITNNIREGIYRGEPPGGLVYVNSALVKMFGFDSAEEMMAEDGINFYSNPKRREELGHLLETKGEYKNEEVEFIRNDGTKFWGINNAVATRGIDGELQHYDGVILDITDQKAAQKRIDYLAHYDPLTGLPNRAYLREQLEIAIARASREHEQIGILFMDLDYFKKVNDSLGHEIGDELLRVTAARIKSVLRPGDIVSRQGGDEFIVALTRIRHRDEIITVAERLMTIVSQPYEISGHELNITPSIGISVYPADGGSIDELIRHADAAMYYVKDKTRHDYQFFIDEINARAVARLEIENELRQALKNEEFVLHYQPFYDLVSGKIVGAEALLRWQSPQRGFVLPGAFISIAEQSGLIGPIGEWVLGAAIRQAREWQLFGLPPVRMAVNISAIQFQRDNLHEIIAGVLAREGFDVSLLELEITESVLIQDAERSINMLQRLDQLGVSLSIDDFGTGYSGLSYLKRFNIDRLKIDQSFVNDVTTSSDDAEIISAIISLANALNLKVTAEGVETKEQLNFLRARGCDEVQGFYFSPPVTAEKFASLVIEHMTSPGKVLE